MEMIPFKKLVTKIRNRWVNRKQQVAMNNQEPEMPEDMVGRIFDLSKKKLAHLDSFNMYVMPNDYIGNNILQTKSYEPHVTKLIKEILKEKDVFLDIGANLGYFTMLASSIVKDKGKVIAFEPNPQNLQLIYASIRENQAKNIEIYPYAASNNKTIFPYISVGSNGGILNEHINAQSYSFLIQSVILDTVLQHETAIDLVKMDVEAHEPFVLEGMIEIIKKHKPKLITEFHPWALKINNVGEPVDYLNKLFDLGYMISIIKTCGELLKVSNSEDIITYWKSLNEETIHLDLYAQQT